MSSQRSRPLVSREEEYHVLVEHLAHVFGLHRVSVYVAMGDVNYIRASGKLQDAGIPFWLKMMGSSAGMMTPNGDLTEYEIFVRLEDEHEAKAALGLE